MPSSVTDDPEQTFEVVALVRVRGYGKRKHHEQILKRLRREVELQFGDAIVEEFGPPVEVTSASPSTNGH